MTDPLLIAGRTFRSRLIVGLGRNGALFLQYHRRREQDVVHLPREHNRTGNVD